jgi:hypothetical protein
MEDTPMNSTRLALVQLSDIHLSPTTNSFASRIPQVAAALRSALIGVRHCIFVFTGDIAATGTSAEYEVAERLIGNLLRWVTDELKPDSLYSVYIPGNHDCNFIQASELRDIIIQKASEFTATIDLKGDFVATCLSVQKNFFEFEARMRNRPSAMALNQQLQYRDVFSIGEKRVRVECFNTAWLSRRHEQPGSLLLPIAAISPSIGEMPSDLVISIFHHPYAWLEVSNRREFQRYVERTSDVVLTGHEHEGDYFSKETSDGEMIAYVEGPVLQATSDPTDSGFNVMLIDTDVQEQLIIRYQWRSDRYERIIETGPRPFIRNRLAKGLVFDNNAQYLRSLSDPGRGFKHPLKASLTLSDIYVYPDLLRRTLDTMLGGNNREPPLLKGEQLLQYVLANRFLVFVGERDSGKSALAKTLYSDLQRLHSLTPLLVSGEDLKFGKDVERMTKRAFTEQYDSNLLEPFRQLPLDRRVLIVDDFHLAPLNARGRQEFIRSSKEMFGLVLLFVDDLFEFDEISEQSTRTTSLVDFQLFGIQPLGHVLRHRLVRKWVNLGRETVINERDLAHETAAKEKILDALIGKNVIPPQPVLILIILQATEASRTATLVSGAYGYYYEVLITEALASVSEEITETGSKYTYLARLAYQMFTTGRETVTEAELETLTNDYADEYRSPVRHDQLLEQLLRSEILRRVGGSISFQYRYYYYYFVARYFKDAAADPKEASAIREQLNKLAARVFFEPNANVLIFYLYLTKDLDLIQQLLNHAKMVFAEAVPARFGADIDKINDLFYAPPKRELARAGDERSREEYLGRLDVEEAKEMTTNSKGQISAAEVEYSSALDISMKYNIAFKLLQLLGQIIKNFPGELKGDLKLDIARECYGLGLRALNVFFRCSMEQREQLTAFIEALLRERQRSTPDQKLLPSKERVLLGLMLAAGFSVIKRISYAVGHDQLRFTHADVLAGEADNLAFKIIDLSIQLDHFSRAAPLEQVRDVELVVRNNPYCYAILQDLVYFYLYLFPTTFGERQTLGQAVGIKVQDVRLLERRSKKLSS